MAVDEQVEINNKNFASYFFDVRRHRPKQGQVMAKFSAVAIFADGPEKRDLIKVLRKDKAVAAAQVMHKIHCARVPDCYRVCREMCEDMLAGMTDDEVAAKEYEFVLEAVYYTQKEYVPKHDPHWETLEVLNYDPESKTYKLTVELPAFDPKNPEETAK